ncbi:hypothetical protein IMSAGC008_01445 [Muribaculaceae bacterium]|jgi:hypothetical protein|nr:hypothetical protein IMSAGC008_01445 [Muribaculaceae bacterium]
MKALNYIYIGIWLILCGTLTACHDENELSDGGARVYLNASVSSDIKLASRAGIDELKENTLIWISKKDKGLVKKFEGLSSLPANGLWLTTGEYVAEGWAGDSVPASFTDRYFTGYAPFTVSKGQSTGVNLNCKIANVVASVNYSEEIDEAISSYSLTVGHEGGELTFEGRDTRKGYFMMSSRSRDLQWTLNGTLPSGETFTRSGTIESPKRATEYTINVNYSGSETTVGGGHFSIEIDETAIEVNHEVVIRLAPFIMGDNFDITKPFYAELGKVGDHAFFVNASAQLSSVIIDSRFFMEQCGLDGNDVDFIHMSDEVRRALESHGIETVHTYDPDLDVASLRVKFSAAFNNALPEGRYDFRIIATDVKPTSNRTEATFSLVVSNAPVKVEDPSPAGIWTSQATLSGGIISAGASEYGFLYRAAASRADGDWQKAVGEVSGNTVTATITGLTPGSRYEYKVYADDFISADIKSFTTDSEQQLPNAGFEEWNTSSKTYLICTDASSMFWDSGNHGSSKMGKNVTQPDETVKHTGQRSIKMESQFVGIGTIGAFAAGNMFVGEFLGTENTTKGILGWGRPWTTRPKALKGYIKYSPQAITHVDSDNLPDVHSGDMDSGILYIALVDDSHKSYQSYKSYPWIVRTADPANWLFSKDKPNVIAYGERIFTEATAGDGMIEFEIPIEYYKTDIKPSNIIVVASASRYGDYYTGGQSSTMWLDDLQLVY